MEVTTRHSAEVRLDELLRTACDVIADRGLANTRAADVAAAAGVSQALVFYHFSTKDRLLAQAFSWWAEHDLERLDEVIGSTAPPLEKMRTIFRIYAPVGSAKGWRMWIDCWAESMRIPELEKVSRRLDMRWKDGVTQVITEGVADGTFTCPDPAGAAWRLMSLVDGLAVQITVHKRVLARHRLAEWVRLSAARELGVSVRDLGG